MYASNLSKNLATMNLSEVDTSVVKATFEDDAPPKEKHMANLVELTRYERDLSFSTSIFKRLLEKKWRIVIKTLILIHRLCRDGDEKCLSRLEARKSQLEPARRFTDKASVAQTHLVRRYANYIDQKLRVYGLTGYSAERVTPTESKEWALKLSLEQAFVALPATQHQFALLLSMDPMYAMRESRYIHPLAVIIFTMLLRDALRMYSVCTVELFVALENYESMDREQTVTFLSCCRKSHEINTAFRQWCQRLARCRIAKDCVPDFTPLPERFFSLLENRLDEFDGKPPRHNLGMGPSHPASTPAPASSSTSSQAISSGTTTTLGRTPSGKSPRPPSQPVPANVKNIYAAPPQQSSPAAASVPAPAPIAAPLAKPVATRQAGALTRLKAERRAQQGSTDEPGAILLPDPSLALNSRRLASPAVSQPEETALKGRGSRVRATRSNNTASTVVVAPAPAPAVSASLDESSDMELFDLYDEEVEEDPFALMASASNQQPTQTTAPHVQQNAIQSQQQQYQMQQQQQQQQKKTFSDPFNFDALDALLSNEESSHINVWASVESKEGSGSSAASPVKPTPGKGKSAFDDDPFAALAAEAELKAAPPSSSSALVLHNSETRSANAMYLYPAASTGFPDRLPVATHYESTMNDHRANAQRANNAEFDPFAGLVKTVIQPQPMYQQPMYQQPMYAQPMPMYGQQPVYGQPMPMYGQQPMYGHQQQGMGQGMGGNNQSNPNYNPF